MWKLERKCGDRNSIGNSWSVLFGEVKRKGSKEEKILESGVKAGINGEWKIPGVTLIFSMPYFPKANLQGCNFFMSRSASSRPWQTDLVEQTYNADLTGANLAGYLRGAASRKPDIQKANLREPGLTVPTFTSQSRWATLAGCQPYPTLTRQANLHGTNLEKHQTLCTPDFRARWGRDQRSCSLYGTKIWPWKLRKIKPFTQIKLATIWIQQNKLGLS